MLWKGIHQAVDVASSEIYSFLPGDEIDHNPFDEEGLIWSFTYLFLDKTAHKVLFFSVRCISRFSEYYESGSYSGGGEDWDESTLSSDFSDAHEWRYRQHRQQQRSLSDIHSLYRSSIHIKGQKHFWLPNSPAVSSIHNSQNTSSTEDNSSQSLFNPTDTYHNNSTTTSSSNNNTNNNNNDNNKYNIYSHNEHSSYAINNSLQYNTHSKSSGELSNSSTVNLNSISKLVVPEHTVNNTTLQIVTLPQSHNSMPYSSQSLYLSSSHSSSSNTFGSPRTQRILPQTFSLPKPTSHSSTINSSSSTLSSDYSSFSSSFGASNNPLKSLSYPSSVTYTHHQKHSLSPPGPNAELFKLSAQGTSEFEQRLLKEIAIQRKIKQQEEEKERAREIQHKKELSNLSTSITSTKSSEGHLFKPSPIRLSAQILDDEFQYDLSNIISLSVNEQINQHPP